jgi:hypothetical protein
MVIRRHRALLVAVLVAGLVLLGRAVLAQDAAPEPETSPAPAVPLPSGVVPYGSSAPQEPPVAPPLAAEPPPPPVPPPAAPVASASGRAAIRQASVGIRSFEPEQTMAAATKTLLALDAYVQESVTGRAEFRVPADHFDAALAALRQVGEVVREDVTSEDVTLEIVTLEARIQELEASRRRVQGMLELAGTVQDSLDVERTLREVTDELEAQQGRLRFVRQRVELSPLALAVSMKERPTVRMPRERQPFRWVESYGLHEVLR